jgi:lysophospholipase L1-like esterase
MRMFRRPSFSKLAKSLLKIILILGVSLLLVEVLMTVFEPQLFKGLYQYDPDLGFRVRSHYPMPDGSVTNQFGFNARDYSLQKPPGVFRILVVGDSFNWAGGFKGNYTALLEQKLDSLYGNHRVDVVNVGYSGTHTAEQLAMLKKFGLQYNPDLVILGFFAGNDFVDADPNRKRIIVNDTYVDIDKRRELKLLGRPIILKSRLYMFLRQKYVAWKEQRVASKEIEVRAPVSFSRETFLNIERARLDLFSLAAAREQKYKPNIDYILQSISEMDALLKSRNIGFVVAIFPDGFQVDQDLLKAVIERYQLNQSDYDVEFTQKLLRSYLETNGIPYVDFLDRFRTVEQKQPLYIPQDTHWNASGNELAAEILLEALARRSDVPKWTPSPTR